MYVYIEKFQSEGSFFFSMFDMTMRGCLCSSILLVAYFGAKQAIHQTPVLLPLPIIIYIVWGRIERKYLKLATTIPLSIAIGQDIIMEAHISSRDKSALKFEESFCKQPNASAPIIEIPYPHRIHGRSLFGTDGNLAKQYYDDLRKFLTSDFLTSQTELTSLDQGDGIPQRNEIDLLGENSVSELSAQMTTSNQVGLVNNKDVSGKDTSIIETAALRKVVLSTVELEQAFTEQRNENRMLFKNGGATERALALAEASGPSGVNNGGDDRLITNDNFANQSAESKVVLSMHNETKNNQEKARSSSSEELEMEVPKKSIRLKPLNLPPLGNTADEKIVPMEY